MSRTHSTIRVALLRLAVVTTTGFACHTSQEPEASALADVREGSGAGDTSIDAWFTQGARSCEMTTTVRTYGRRPEVVTTTAVLDVQLDARTESGARVRIDARPPWTLEVGPDGVHVRSGTSSVEMTDMTDDPRSPTWSGIHQPVPVPGGATEIRWELTACRPDACRDCTGGACGGCDATQDPAPCADGFVTRTTTTRMQDGEYVVHDRCGPAE